MRRMLRVAVVGFAFALGVALAWLVLHRPAPLPDAPALIEKVREVARLETLDVRLYRKIAFEPDPVEQKSAWSALAQWASYQVHPPRGRAIVFAEAHLALDLRKLDAEHLRVSGRTVQVVLPPVQVSVELRPGETEIIGSNLDSAQTAALFEKARGAFEAEVTADAALRERARASARTSLRALCLGLGYSEVQFVDALPRAPGHL